jgi:hypothetical protein
MSTSTRATTASETDLGGFDGGPGWLPVAAGIAGVAGIGLGIYHVATPGPPGADFDSWDDFVLRDGLFLVYLLGSIAAVTGLWRARTAPRASARLVGIGYSLIAIGVAVSLVLREDPDWFFVLGGPGILLSIAGFVVLAVAGWRRRTLPGWAAALAGVGGVLAILMAELGTTVLIGSFWLHVAANSRRAA